ncbi:hypothetical protein A4X13_0g8106 [Tilletia indica]|uniref:Uncharacterized protein n=1 Tax=Tilletia indica TaxID=43049 RepID=A0A177TP46_9BASI|nr:hypothetical protein A4X13_0g8106 [Tilletia indica]
MTGESHPNSANTPTAPPSQQLHTKSRAKTKQRSASSNEGTGSGSGNDHHGSRSGSGSISGSTSVKSGHAAASALISDNNNVDNSVSMQLPEDTSIMSSAGNGGGGEEKKTRKQVQNRTAQRRYRGRQAEYVKQLETEIELLKADPSFRESVKDEWIRQLQEDNRQLKAFILGPHRITLTEGVDVLLRKSYAIEEGILRPFVSSPVLEHPPILAEGSSSQDRPRVFNASTARSIPNIAEESANSSAGQNQGILSHNNYMGTATTSSNTARNHTATFTAPQGNLYLGEAGTSATSTGTLPYGTQSQHSTRSAVPVNVAAAPTIDQYSLRLPPTAAQPPDPHSFAGMSQFLASTALGGDMNLTWQAQNDVSGHAPTDAYGNGNRRADQGLPNQAAGSSSIADYHNASQALSHQYPDLTSSSLLPDNRQISPTSGGAAGLVANRHNSDDAMGGPSAGGNQTSDTTRSNSLTSSNNIFANTQSSSDGPPLSQKRRIGGYLGMSHEDTADSGVPGGKSGGNGGPSPIHVLPSQLYSQREQLSAMIRHVFDTPGSNQIDFSSPDFSYEPYQQRLEPIFRFCWSWAMAIWPDEPEMEVAGMAWIIFLFSNAAVNFYLKLPEFLRPTREQQSLPHEAAVMFVPWKDLRNQMVLLDGFVNFRIVGELVNCTCLQAGQYKPNAGPIGAPKPASAYGEMRHIKELTYFDENFIPFDHLIDIDNWRLSRDAISRFPQLEIPERLIEAGDVRKRKEQSWAQQKGSQGVYST